VTIDHVFLANFQCCTCHHDFWQISKTAPDYFLNRSAVPKSVKSWIADKNLRLLPWPTQSSDLNPIENLWNEMERRIAGRKFANSDSLFDVLDKEWKALPKNLLDKLVKSM
jgi:transposase